MSLNRLTIGARLNFENGDGRTQERERRIKVDLWHVQTILESDLEDESGFRRRVF